MEIKNVDSFPTSLPSSVIHVNNSAQPVDISSTQLLNPSTSPSPAQAQTIRDNEPQHGLTRKFLSFNKFNLKTQGHRVIVVRDESFIVFMQELKKTKDVMPDFTQQLMQLIDKSAAISQQSMKELIPYANPAGRDICDAIQNEIHKTRFCIRGFSNIYDISEEQFIEPGYKRLQVEACLNEIKNASRSDLTAFKIDVKIQAKF